MNNYGLTVFLLLLAAMGSFYWFSIHTGDVRSSCSKETSQYEQYGNWTPDETTLSYDMCIHAGGIAE